MNKNVIIFILCICILLQFAYIFDINGFVQKTSSGWNVTDDELTNGTIKITKDGITNIYTWADLYVIRLIIMDDVVPDEDMISHYDFDGDGEIHATDYGKLKTMLKALE